MIVSLQVLDGRLAALGAWLLYVSALSLVALSIVRAVIPAHQ